jgi:hypothetical protein
MEVVLRFSPQAPRNQSKNQSRKHRSPSFVVISPAPLNFHPVKSQRAISLGPAVSGAIQLGLILSIYSLYY